MKQQKKSVLFTAKLSAYAIGYTVIMQGIYMEVVYELSVAYWRHIGSMSLVNFDPGGGL